MRNLFFTTFFFLSFISLKAQSTLQPAGHTLNFGSASDYVEIDGLKTFDFSSREWSVSLWMKPQYSTDSEQGILTKRFDSNDLGVGNRFHDFSILYDRSSRQIIFDYNAGGGTKRSVSDEFGDDIWTHLVVMHRSDSVFICVNGSVSDTFYIPNSIRYNSTVPVYLGSAPESGGTIKGNQSFTGSIDELQLWGGTLTEAQIQQMMYRSIDDAFIDGSVSGLDSDSLIAYYRFDQGTASGSNSAIDTIAAERDIIDGSNTYNGELVAFSLSGDNSNWINSSAPVGVITKADQTFPSYHSVILEGTETGIWLGTDAITERGVVYSLTSNFDPFFTSSSLMTYVSSTDPLGNSDFTVNVNDLLAGQRYNYKAYIRTTSGHYAFGKERSFTTGIEPSGNALYFDGVNDSLGVYLIEKQNDSEWSVDFWVKPASNISGSDNVIFQSYFNTITLLKLNYDEGNDEFDLSYFQSGSQTNTFAAGLTKGEWNHVLLSVSSSAITYYLNGVSQGVVDASFSPTRVARERMVIGTGINTGTKLVENGFTGELDEFRLWNTDVSGDLDKIRFVETSKSVLDTISGVTATHSDLMLYFNFNQGEAYQDNSGNGTLPAVKYLTDGSENGYDGEIAYFSLGYDSHPSFIDDTISNFTKSELFKLTTLETILDIGLTSATLTGHVDGPWFENGMISRGVVISEIDGFDPRKSAPGDTTMFYSVTPFANDTFEIQVNNLKINTRYFYMVFARSSEGVFTYANQEELLTSIDPPGYGLSFDGSDDEIVTGLTRGDLGDDYTLSAWYRYDGNTTDYYQPIIGSINGTTSDFFLGKNGNNDQFRVRDGTSNWSTSTYTNAWDGNWHNVTLVKNSGYVTLYLDGQAIDWRWSIATGTAVNAIMVGRDRWINRTFNGAIDEVRIWDEALTQEEILKTINQTIDEDYVTNNLTSVTYSNLLVYYRFDAGLPEGDNTSISQVQDFGPNGNPGVMNNFALTGTSSNFIWSNAALGVKTLKAGSFIETTAQVKGVITGIWTVSTPDGGGFCYSTTPGFAYRPASTTKISATLSNDTLSAQFNSLSYGETYYYRAFAVNGNDTVWGEEESFATVMDIPGNALSNTLSGTDDYMLVNEGIDVSNQSFTMELWAKKLTSGSDGYFFGQGINATSSGLHLGYANSTNLGFRFYGNDANINVQRDDKWHHYSFVYDADTKTRRIYMDGKIVLSYTNTARDHYLGTGVFVIGAGRQYDNEFEGTMDEVRIWDVAMSSAEVNELMSRSINQTWVDANLTSGNWNNLLAYYTYDQGIAGGDNTQEGLVKDQSQYGRDGYLNWMALMGSTSNIIDSDAPIGLEMVSLTADDNSADMTAQTTGIWYSGATPDKVGFFYSDESGFDASSATELASTIIVNQFSASASGLGRGETYYVRGFAIFGTDTAWTKEELTVTQFNPPGNNLKFEGDNDYVITPYDASINLDTNFTVEAWVKGENTNWTGSDGIVVKQNSYMLRTRGGTKNMYFYIYAGGGWRYTEFVAPYGFDIRVWHHYAGVYENDTIRIYMDGDLFRETAVTQTIDAENESSLTVGSWGTGSYFDGHIDEVRIWNRTLSTADIQLIKNRTLTESWVDANMNSASWSNLRAYYRFDQGTAGGDNTSETKLFDYSDYQNHGNLMNMTLIGDNSNFVGSQAYLGVQTHEVLNIGFTEATMRGSLTGYWLDPVDTVGILYSATQGFDPSTANGVDVFEEIANALERSGDIFTIDVAGLLSGKKYFFRAFVTKDGKQVFGEERMFATSINPPGNALAFDGEDDYVRVYNDSTLSPSGEISIEFWAKSATETWSGYYSHLFKRNQYWIIPYQGSRRLDFRVYNEDGSNRNLRYDIPEGIDIQDWHHYSFTYDGQIMRTYIDGKQVASRIYTTIEAINIDDRYNLRIGRSYNSSNYNYEGQLDEVRIWHKALTATQIDYLKNRTIDEELVNDMVGITWDELGLYYRFDQGIAGAENPGEYYVFDFSGKGNRGILYNFQLVGTESNWVRSNAALGVTTLTDFEFENKTATFNAITTDLWEGTFTERGIAYSTILNFSPADGDAFSTEVSTTPLANDTFSAEVKNLSSKEMIFYRGYATTGDGLYSYGESQVFVPGINPPGNALKFEGDDDRLSISHSGSIAPTEEITIEFWTKSDGDQIWVDNGFLLKNYAYRIYTYQNSDRIQFLVWTSDGSYRYFTYDPPATFDVGQWHHYAMTYDGYTLSAYVDGLLKMQQDYGSFLPIRDTHTNSLYLGYYNSTNYFDGEIDEFRIWQKALSQVEIQDMMNRTIDNIYVNDSTNLSWDDLGLYYRFDQGVAGQNNTGIPIVYDYTGNKNFGVFENFQLVSLNSNFVTSHAGIGVATLLPTNVSFDQATLNGKLTGIFYDDIDGKGFLISDQPIDPNNPGAAFFTFIPVAGTEPGEFSHVEENLGYLTKYYYYAYYELDNGDKVYGNQQTFTTTLNPPGHALHFDRTDDRINMLDLDIVSKDTVTVDFWMNWEGTYNMMPMGFSNYSLYLNGGFFGFFTNSNDHYAMNNAGELANKWVHVAAVFVRNDVYSNKLYINGELQELEQKITEPTARDFGVNFRIGTMNNTGAYDFEGTIDEFRFWNKELTVSQISEVMDQTLDASVVDSITGLAWENLLTYYRFDQGTPGGDNTAITEINDLSNYHIDGENLYFTMDGDRSNFVESAANIGVKTVPTVTDQVEDEVKLYGEITGIWNTHFVDSGFVYATSENFTTSPLSATYVAADLDEGSNQYAKVVGGLPHSTIHYFRAYVASEWDTPSGTVRDTVYGIEKEFYTAGVYPLDKYSDMQNDEITLFYRSVGTPITPGALTTGVKYSTSEGFDPTATGTVVAGGAFSGDTMAANVTGLTEGETYYYRPYVTDGSTTLYGEEKFFVSAMDAQGNALTFNANGDHIAVNAGDQLMNTLNFTVSFWLNYTNTGTRYVFEIPRFGSTAYGMTLLTNRNDQGGNEVGKIAALYITSSNSAEYLGSTRSDLNDGEWHEVVITMGESGGKMYVDGVLEAASEYTFDINGFGTEPTYIGSYYAGGHFIGGLDEFRIWDKELDVLQMDQLRNRTIDEDYINNNMSGLDWENLKLYYRFDQGVAGADNTGEDKIFDYSQYAWHGNVTNLDLTGTNANWIESAAYLGVKTVDPGAIYTLGEATLEGNLTGLIYSEPVDTGFEYSLTEGFVPGTGTSILANVHEDDTVFKRLVTGLDPTQRYYFRAFANLANGRTNYGEEKFFIPGGVETLDSTTNVDGASAEIYGFVTGDFVGLGVDTGMWFAPEANFNPFAYPGNKVSLGNGALDTFMIDITGLDAGTNYYYKAYVDIGGTFIFGEEQSFKTLFNPPGNKLDFSLAGTDDWISLNQLGNELGTTSASGFSFEGWMMSEVQTVNRTIFNLVDSIAELDRLWFFTGTLNGERILRVRINNTYYNSQQGIEDTVWHHVVLTVDPAMNKTYVYVDGIEVMDIDDVPATLEATDVLSLGANYTTNRGFRDTYVGQMDEVRFWNKPLSTNQIDELIYRTIDQDYVDNELNGVSWSNLIGYYRMDQGLGGNENDTEFQLHDMSSHQHDGVLNYFNLDGTTSNWLISDAPIGVVTLDLANAYGANGGDFFGLITDRWYSAPLDTGIVYSDVSGFDPDTVVTNKLSSGVETTTDTFKVEIRDILNDGQFYYYRAYVQENDSTWIYGREMSFYAGGIVTLDTTSNITSSEARTMGEILANFPTAIDTGVVYYLVQGSDPDTVPAAQFITTLQTNVDTFVVDLSDLEPSTKYYYRAYVDLGAANGGVIYGAEYSFITFSTPPGRALDLNNTNDYLEVNNDVSISPVNEITYELWLKSNFPTWQTASGGPVILNKGDSYHLSADRNGTRIRAYIYIAGAGWRERNFTPPSGFRINEWHHYAVTFDGFDMKLYVDGDLMSTYTYSTQQTINVDNRNLQIGHDARTTNITDRNSRIQVDEFRLWNKALTQENIRQMMTRTLIEDYVNNWVDGVSWSDLGLYYMFDDGFNSADNTELITAEDASDYNNKGYFQNVDLSGTESNYVASGAAAGVITDSLIYNTDSATAIFVGHLTGKWYTLPAQVGFQYSTSYDFTVAPVTVYGSLQADSAFSATVTGLTPGETYYYRALTETGSAIGYGYRRTYVPLNFNPNGNALAFDGSNDYVLSRAAEYTLDLASKSFTVETWAKKQSANENGYFMGLGTGTTSHGLHVGYGSSNSIRFNFWGNDVYTTIISDSLWHHFAFSYDASTYTRNIYMDGRLIRTYTNTDRDHFLGVGNLFVGRNINGTNFGGSLDEFRIWETALTEEQVNTMMNRSIDSSYVDKNVSGLSWDDLKVYYRFDQGDANLDNTGEYHLFDYANPRHEGYLYNFALTGTTSNWIRNSAPIGVEITRIAEINTTTASIQGQVTGRWYNDIVKRGVIVTTIDSLDFETVADPLDTTRFWTDDDISVTEYTVDLYALEMGKQYKVAALAISSNGDTAYSKSQTITTVMNPPGHAIALDGNNDLISVPGDSIRLDNRSFTIETWARKRLPNDRGYFGWQGTTTTENGLYFGYADWNTIRFNIYGPNVQFDIAAPDSLWHHFAFVYDYGTNNYKIYMDGNEMQNYTNAAWGPYKGTGDFTVGRYYNNYTFDGELDEYRIWTQAISQDDIREMMHRTIDEDYIINNIPTVEWDSLKLYYRFDQGIANGSNPGVNEVIDFSGNESNGILTNFDLSGDVSNWVQSLAPVGVYITSDADPIFAGEATVKGQVTGIWYSEIVDSGFVYSTEQYFDATDASSMFETTNLTADADTFRTRILGLEHSTTYYYKPYVITIDNDTTYGDEREFTTYGIATLDSAQNITGTTMTLYGRAVNAMPVASDTGFVYSTVRDFDPTAVAADIFRQSGSLLNSTTTAFGSNITGMTPSTLYYYRAYITDGTDSLFGEQRIVRSLSNPSGNALHLDGTNDYVELPADLMSTSGLSNSNEITIEFWYKGNDLQQAVRIQEGAENYIIIGFNDPPLAVFSNSSGVAGAINISNNVTIEDDQWHHIAITWKQGQSSGFRAYVDGVMVDDNSSTNIPLPNFTSGASVSIGSYNGNGSYPFMDGSIDELRIWNKALSAAQLEEVTYRTIDQTYVDTDVTGLTWTDLVAYYRMDQGEPGGDNTVIDYLDDFTGNSYDGLLQSFAKIGATSNFVDSEAFPGLHTVDDYNTPSSTEAEVWGVETGIWYSNITGRGAYYSEVENFDTADVTTTKVYYTAPMNVDTFTTTLSGLTIGTTYYFRAFLETDNGEVALGQERSLVGGGVQTLLEAEKIGGSSVIVYGDVLGDFTAALDSGAVFSTVDGFDPSDYTGNFISSNTAGVDTFAVQLSGLTVNTEYFYRAYIINSVNDTIYGSQRSIITADNPAGNALHYDGLTNYIGVIEKVASEISASGEMSVELWMKPDDVGKLHTLLGFTSSNGAVNRIILSVGSNDQLTAIVGASNYPAIGGGINVVDDMWHHVAVVSKESSDSTWLYIDGELAGVADQWVGIESTDILGIGVEFNFISERTPVSFYSGMLDEVRIWDHALNEDELDLFLYRTLSEEFIDTLPDLTGDNLVAYYRFDQGVPGGDNTGIDQLYDFSGNEYHGQLQTFNLTGTTSNWVQSEALTGVETLDAADPLTNSLFGVKTGMWFNGYDSAGIVVSEIEGFEPLTGNFTRDPLLLNDTIEVIPAGVTAGGTYYYRAYVSKGGSTKFGKEMVFEASGIYTLNIFESIGGEQITLFGKLQGTIPNITEYGIQYSENSDMSSAATTTVAGVPVDTFNVTLSGLSPETKYYFQALVNTSAPGTVYGDTLSFVTLANPAGNALELDGSGGHLSYDDNAIVDELFNATDGITIETWFNTAQVGTQQAFWGLHNSTGALNKFVLDITNVDELAIYLDDTRYTIGNDVTDGEWHHIAVVSEKSPAETRVYLDGVEVFSRSEWVGVNSNDQLIIGGELDGSVVDEAFIGQLDEFRIWDKPLTPGQIDTVSQATLDAAYVNALTGLSWSDLVAYYNFDFSDPDADNTWLNEVYDISGNDNGATLDGIDLTGSDDNFVASDLQIGIRPTGASNIDGFSADLSGEVIGSWYDVTNVSRGFAYSQIEDFDPLVPAEVEGIVASANGIGSFTTNAAGLRDGTLYYYRPFAEYNGSRVYGVTDTFTTVNTGLYYVDIDAAGANNGSSWADAYNSLSDALGTAGADDTIFIAEGIYYPQTDASGNATPADNRDKTFLVRPGVLLAGGFNGTEADLTSRAGAAGATILSGDLGLAADASDNAYHVVSVDGYGTDTVVFDAVTITDGNADGAIYRGYGGGVYAPGHHLEIVNSTIRDNAATNGGAIYINSGNNGSLAITNTTFVNNMAHKGAVIYAFGFPLMMEFDGINDYVQAENPNSASPRSYFTWFAEISTTDTRTFASKDQAPAIISNSDGSMILFVDNGYLGYYDAIDGVTSVVTPVFVADGIVHEVAMVRENNVVRLYVDGVQAGSDIATGTSSESAANLIFGYGSTHYDGQIYGIRHYSLPLSQAQVQNIDGVASNLEASYTNTGVTGGAAGTWADQSGNGLHGVVFGTPDLIGTADTTVVLINNTLVSNTYSTEGILYNEGSLITIENSILWNQSDELGGDDIVARNSVLRGGTGDNAYDLANGIWSYDPILDANGLSDNGGLVKTIKPLYGPVVNAGDTSVAPLLDANGDARVDDVDLGAVEYLGSGVSGASVDVTTAGEYLTAGSFGTLNIRTIDFWVKTDIAEGGLFNLSGNTISLNASNQIELSGASLAGSDVYVDGVAGNDIENGIWQHVTIVPSANFNLSAIEIGRDGSNELVAHIDEVRFWNVALTETQIDSLMFVELTNDGTNLVDPVNRRTVLEGTLNWSNLIASFRFYDDDFIDIASGIEAVGQPGTNVDAVIPYEHWLTTAASSEWSEADNWYFDVIPDISNSGYVVLNKGTNQVELHATADTNSSTEVYGLLMNEDASFEVLNGVLIIEGKVLKTPGEIRLKAPGASQIKIYHKMNVWP